jgi:hypothetical protein
MATLTSNVNVDGTWYGPDWPQNPLTEEVAAKITNPAAFADPPAGVDLRFTAADFGVTEGDQPHLRSVEATAALTVTPPGAPPDPAARLASAPTAAEAASVEPSPSTPATSAPKARKG